MNLTEESEDVPAYQNELSRSRLSTVRTLQTHTQTEVTESITVLHSQVVIDDDHK